MSEINVIPVNSVGIINLIPAKLLPNPKNNACMTCPNATWSKVGNKAMCHCSKMFIFTWGNGNLQDLDENFEQMGVEICDGNPQYKPEPENKNS